jgi:DtxR family Mn-dependent transcriptional regulator
MKQSTQNYLKTIFSLSANVFDTVVKVSDISKKLDISPAAVTDMVKKLEQEGFVKSQPYRGLVLTETGWKIGCNMVRHHRLWEAFLHHELGLPWDKVHAEAERLEHACSDELINKIEEKMGYPTNDPHGNPIPDRNGNMPPSQ